MLTEINLDTALDGSQPNPVVINESVQDALEQLVDSVSTSSTRAQKTRTIGWRRPAVLIPAIAALAIATTAGAIAYSFGATDAGVIPINYTTSNGQQVSCGYGVSGSSQVAVGSTAALREYVHSHDWTGIGQKVYRYAIAHPYVPTPAEAGTLTRNQIDSFSFSQALAAVIGDAIPASVEPTGYLAGGESDCRGTLR